jgi:non-heme chloroperoxidase
MLRRKALTTRFRIGFSVAYLSPALRKFRPEGERSSKFRNADHTVPYSFARPGSSAQTTPYPVSNAVVANEQSSFEHRSEGEYMRVRREVMISFGLFLCFCKWALPEGDSSPHKIQMIEVEPGVRLEVLDWGGSGRPIIFLAGSGDTAHRFDGFASQFTKQYRVYGITRRGYGASSAPAPTGGNYAADHLGDDVLAVMKALSIERPVLVGHSLAGEELSSIGSRFPNKVSGLIYLDAATSFALYDPSHPTLEIEMNDVKRRIDEIEGGGVDEQKKLLELETVVKSFEAVLHQSNAAIANLPPIPPRSPINAAIEFGQQRYTSIPVPALAIFACPHNWDRMPDSPRKTALIGDDKARCTTWADSFRRGVATARIVMIPNADHYVYLSNAAEVVNAMNGFLSTLP